MRGLNALIATLATATTAPIIVAQRLRKGACGSPRGANRLIADAVKQARRLLPAGTPVLVRMDSAYWGRPSLWAAIRGGANVSVTVKMSPTIKTAIATIDEQAWTTIKYTDAIFNPDTQQWISTAEVAEVAFTAFSSQKKAEQIPGRLVVRRIPDFNAATKAAAGQDGLFDTWRFHAFFTTTDPTVFNTITADTTHRGHAVIEQVNADLKASALAHLPSGGVHGQRRLAGAGRHGLQPHTRRSHPDRDWTGKGHHRHHPPHTDHRPSQDRILSPPARAASTNSLALGSRLD